MDIRTALTLFIYEVFLLILSAIIIFSATVSGIFNLFRAEHNTWLLSTPCYAMFPKFIFIKSLWSSMLPLLVLFLPAVLALNKVHHIGGIGILIILLSVILTLVTINALTLLLLLLISKIYYTLSLVTKKIRFTFKGVLILFLASAILLSSRIWSTVSSIDLIKIFKADVDSEILSVSNISDYFSYLPTHPLALEMLHLQNMELGSTLVNLLVLVIISSVSFGLWWFFSSYFYPLWLRLQDGDSQKITSEKKISSVSSIYRFTGGKTFALFKKEILVSSRNFKGILWFSFLMFIWLMQIMMNLILGDTIQKNQTDVSQKLVTLQLIQYIIAIYFISSFVLRFAFPSFSMERKTAWILASAPVSFARIFFGKYLFYASFFVILGSLMSYINIKVLGLSFTHGAYGTLLLASTIIFIVTLGLTLGALFPNYETDDPEIISTSMTGLFFTGVALIYGALSDWTLYRLISEGETFWVNIFIFLTLFMVIILLYKVPKLIKNTLV